MRLSPDIDQIAQQFIDIYAPQKLFLFGSNARNESRANSDVDLCVVLPTDNRRRLLADMYYNIQSEKPIDIILYTPEQWSRNIEDKTSFAYKISTEGVALHG